MNIYLNFSLLVRCSDPSLTSASHSSCTHHADCMTSCVMMCDVVSPAATGGGDRGSAKGKSGGTKKRKSAVASHRVS